MRWIIHIPKPNKHIYYLYMDDCTDKYSILPPPYCSLWTQTIHFRHITTVPPVLQKEQSGDWLCELCVSMIEGIVIYLFWARVWCCALVSDASDEVIEGAIVRIRLFIFLVLMYLVNVIVCWHFIFCFVCARLMFLYIK